MATFTVQHIRGALRVQMHHLGWAHLDTSADAETFVRFLPSGREQELPIAAIDFEPIAKLRTINAAADAVHALAQEWHGIADAHRYGSH